MSAPVSSHNKSPYHFLNHVRAGESVCYVKSDKKNIVINTIVDPSKGLPSGTDLSDLAFISVENGIIVLSLNKGIGKSLKGRKFSIKYSTGETSALTKAKVMLCSQEDILAKMVTFLGKHF